MSTKKSTEIHAFSINTHPDIIPNRNNMNCLMFVDLSNEKDQIVVENRRLKCFLKDFNIAVNAIKESTSPEESTFMLKNIKNETPKLTEAQKDSILQYNPLNNYDYISISGTSQVEAFVYSLQKGKSLQLSHLNFDPETYKNSYVINSGQTMNFWTFKTIESAYNVSGPLSRTVKSYFESFTNGSQTEFFKQFYNHAKSGSAFIRARETAAKISELLHKKNDE
ncbi:hypothetical protein BB561_002222 [Smittium simulii]|uniref:Uncharacterized protein n=1 Tax=Smittium simulii TaxID=133385 RepID=A0A2T9YRB1_9FUNG|nr:hypothetical protein BB561_002222 [Smittium simulii]